MTATETVGAMWSCGNRATVPDKKNPRRGKGAGGWLLGAWTHPIMFQAGVSIGHCGHDFLRLAYGGYLRETPHGEPSGNVRPCGARVSRWSIAKP